MTDPELIRRAEAAGIAARYENWRHEQVEVPEETLRAILTALAAQPSGGAGAASQAGDAPGTEHVDVSTRAPETRGRAWGFAVQLYSVRSRGSWGHGDLHDLAELAMWSARDLGAGFVLVNPLHAAEPVPPLSPSPYLPMTRRYSSPLYLRIEDIPEYGRLPPAARTRIERLAGPLRARNTSPGLIDRDEVWAAKRTALDLIRQVPLTPSRQAALDAYLEQGGLALRCWASWCALAEQHGPDWRKWPAELRDREGGLAGTAHGELASAAGFHAWLQWLVDDQLAAAQDAAVAAGMPYGVIHDLAVGVHPGGADAWAYQDLLVSGISVGAPPDSFNQRGQNWAQLPWHPQRLAAAGFRPLAELFAAAFRHAGGLRIDHVMGLMRLWWVPEGMTADRGAYIRYDHAGAVAALVGEAKAAGALAIGEDLGTVDDWIRSYLAEHAVLGTMMAWFATEPDGSPLQPAHWRRHCMATVGTHDVPTVAGFLTGAQVTERARLGLLTASEQEERASSAASITAWQDALEAAGLLTAANRDQLADFTVAMYAYLARTPALLLGVSLADAVGDVRSQNIPGTSTEYPNWRIPLCAETGAPVLLEELPAVPLLMAVTRAVCVS